MSVTFTPEPGPIDYFLAHCHDCGAKQSFRDGDAAMALLRANDEGDAYMAGCAKTGPFGCIGMTSVDPVEADGPTPEVNMANTNARHILDLLGLPTDDELVGGLPADDVLGRALLALAVAPADEGVPAHEMAGPGATLIDCGRPEGYSEDRLRGIVEVAEWARDHNRDVQWA